MSVAQVLPPALRQRIDQLDPLPLAANRLLERLGGRDISAAALVDVIEFDQALAATVLREARTMRFSAYQAPDSVHEAVLRLGTAALLDLVLEAHLASLRQAMPTYDLSVDDQWAHSAAAQLSVRMLAHERPALKMPAVAETAALMHDIGKLVMTRHFGITSTDITGLATRTGVTFVEAERALLGLDHAAVGAAMAEKWNLPPLVVDAIRWHHTAPPPAPHVVLDAVALGNLVAKTVASGLGAEGLNLSVEARMFGRLGLTFAAFGRICLDVAEGLSELRAARARN